MNLRKLILTSNDCYKAGKPLSPKGVMVHSTGANNPSLKRYVGPDDGLLGYNKNNNHWNAPGIAKCVHAFIGKLADGSIAAYQTLPWDMRGWHCGKGPKGSGNDTHLSFEICEDGLVDSVYFGKVFQEAVELTAYLCALHGLNPLADGVVIGHYEGHARGIASNHADPGNWFPKHGTNMDAFRKAVAVEMAKGKPVAPPEPDPDVDPGPPMEHWAAPYRQRLIGMGIEISDERYDDPVTRGEMFTLMARALEAVGK